jgi:Glycosyl hydrolase family 63 N-terminal domain
MLLLVATGPSQMLLKTPLVVATTFLAVAILPGSIGFTLALNATIAKLCGTYRSYPYVGLQCQYPHSPSMGLLWYQPSHVQKGIPLRALLRHEANHDDGLQRFGWNQHDGAAFGAQEIVDPKNKVKLTVQWVHLGTYSSNETARWVLRVTGETQAVNPTDLSLLWYVGMPGNFMARYSPTSGIIHGTDFQTCIGIPNTTRFASYQDDRTNTSKIYSATYFAAFQVSSNQYFDPKPTILQELRNPTSSLPPHLFDPSSLYRAETVLVGNQIVQQLFLTTPFQIDFNSACSAMCPGFRLLATAAHAGERPRSLSLRHSESFKNVSEKSLSRIGVGQSPMTEILPLPIVVCRGLTGRLTGFKQRNTPWEICSAAFHTCTAKPKSTTIKREGFSLVRPLRDGPLCPIDQTTHRGIFGTTASISSWSIIGIWIGVWKY